MGIQGLTPNHADNFVELFKAFHVTHLVCTQEQLAIQVGITS